MLGRVLRTVVIRKRKCEMRLPGRLAPQKGVQFCNDANLVRYSLDRYIGFRYSRTMMVKRGEY